MKKPALKLLIPAIAASALYLSCAPPSADSSPEVGKAAKDFSLKTMAGNAVKPSDFKGQVLLMGFLGDVVPPPAGNRCRT